jgi:hypothetical protein
MFPITMRSCEYTVCVSPPALPSLSMACVGPTRRARFAGRMTSEVVFTSAPWPALLTLIMSRAPCLSDSSALTLVRCVLSASSHIVAILYHMLTFFCSGLLDAEFAFCVALRVEDSHCWIPREDERMLGHGFSRRGVEYGVEVGCLVRQCW